MKAAVFSDSHGQTVLMEEAVRRTRPDVIIHLGDHDRDAVALREKFPDYSPWSSATAAWIWGSSKGLRLPR